MTQPDDPWDAWQGHAHPHRCRCVAYYATPCTARATQEDRLCDQCRGVEQRYRVNHHEGNGGWPHAHGAAERAEGVRT